MHRRLSAILIAAGVAVAIAGCGSSGSSGSGTARTLGDQACGAVFKMRNGGVNNLGTMRVPVTYGALVAPGTSTIATMLGIRHNF